MTPTQQEKLEVLTTLKNAIDAHRSNWKDRRRASNGPDTPEYKRANIALAAILNAEKYVDNKLTSMFDHGPIPPWASHASNGRFDEIGAQLATRDGRRHGNAVVVEITFSIERGLLVFAVTDAGNNIGGRTLEEMEASFYPPRWVMDKRELKRFLQVIDQHSEGDPREGFKKNNQQDAQ